MGNEDAMENEAAAKAWYVIRVQLEKEEQIKGVLQTKSAVAGLTDCFGEIIIPSESLSEVKGGKTKITRHKIYPGYMLVEMELTDETWLLVTETQGISGFVGSNKRNPEPLEQQEVEKILRDMKEKKEKPKPKVAFEAGESVKIKEGPFENYDGVVDEVFPDKGLVKVNVAIFGRSTPVELEFWQVERI